VALVTPVPEPATLQLARALYRTGRDVSFIPIGLNIRRGLAELGNEVGPEVRFPDAAVRFRCHDGFRKADADRRQPNVRVRYCWSLCWLGDSEYFFEQEETIGGWESELQT
jgi:hypothetical protein